MEKGTVSDDAEAMQEFQLEEIERRASDLTHRWMNRVVWELGAVGTVDLNEASVELVHEATQVLDLLERVHNGVHRLRRLAD